MDIRDPKGRFDTNEALNNFKNELIGESERAIQEANKIIESKRYQANLLAERMKLSEKRMGKENHNYLRQNADKYFDEGTRNFIHDIKGGNK